MLNDPMSLMLTPPPPKVLSLIDELRFLTYESPRFLYWTMDDYSVTKKPLTKYWLPLDTDKVSSISQKRFDTCGSPLDACWRRSTDSNMKHEGYLLEWNEWACNKSYTVVVLLHRRYEEDWNNLHHRSLHCQPNHHTHHCHHNRLSSTHVKKL
jgi:hypothetical protein